MRAASPTTARAPSIGNGGSSIACTTVTRPGAAAPSTIPIEAVAASRGTWLQRSTQPSQPVPKAASRICPACVLRMQQIAAAATRVSTAAANVETKPPPEAR